MVNEVARLRWRCRRGMRELDVLLTRYLEHRYEKAPPAEQALFQDLLQESDPVLFAWVMGREEAPDEAARQLLWRIRTGD